MLLCGYNDPYNASQVLSKNLVFVWNLEFLDAKKEYTRKLIAQGSGLTQFNFANGSISTVYGPAAWYTDA